MKRRRPRPKLDVVDDTRRRALEYWERRLKAAWTEAGLCTREIVRLAKDPDGPRSGKA